MVFTVLDDRKCYVLLCSIVNTHDDISVQLNFSVIHDMFLLLCKTILKPFLYQSPKRDTQVVTKEN